MFLEILFLWIGCHLSTAQIINHHIPEGLDGSSEHLKWPALNIIMHVPNANGTLKKVPIYQDPTTIRRQKQKQQENLKKIGSYYSTLKDALANEPPPSSEWAMGRPPGVRFERPPGVNYETFQTGSGLKQNKTHPMTRFSAMRKNSTIMNMDVMIHPLAEDVNLETISEEDKEPDVLYKTPQSQRKQLATSGRHSNNNPSNDRFMHKQFQHKPQQMYTEDDEEDYRSMNDTNDPNDFNDQYADQQYDDNIYKMENKPSEYEPASYEQNTQRNHKNKPEQNRRNTKTSRQQQGPKSGLRRYIQQVYPPEPKQPPHKPLNFSFGGSKSTSPIFWDGNSPMNISITQRDKLNNTIFSYNFDPSLLMQKNNTSHQPTSYSTRIPIRSKNTFHQRHQAKPAVKLTNEFEDEAPVPPEESMLFYKKEPSGIIGLFPKHPSTVFQIPDSSPDKTISLHQWFTSYSKLRKQQASSDDQDSAGSYVHQATASNPVQYSGEQINSNTDKNKFVLMQLKKPNNQGINKDDFEAKVEPLIITSIYRQFLADLKKNESKHDGVKKKLHFSFKLGPGYFNKDPGTPVQVSVDEKYKQGDKYDNKLFYRN